MALFTRKSQFILEGLCCGNCAKRVEQGVAGLPGVSKSSVELHAKSLTVRHSGRLPGLLEDVLRICDEVEPGIAVGIR